VLLEGLLVEVLVPMLPLVLAVAEEVVVLTTLGMLVLAVMVTPEEVEVVEVLLRTA
jgi:hypothetical protein